MTHSTRLSLALTLLLLPLLVMANNLQLENVTLSSANTTAQTVNIQFDISWENSWRENGDGIEFADNNWDAAWLFAKYRLDGGDWQHCTLATEGHVAPAGSIMESPTSDNNHTGVFMYRSAAGFGNNNWTNAQMKWNYGTDGVAIDANVEIRLFGIEMVYVPQGSFWLGDGSSYGTFRQSGSNTPVQITDSPVNVKCENTSYDDAQLEGAGIKVDGANGICTTGTGDIDNPDYPTGYQAFYLMKYGITQGQYADFLNTLTATQASSRYYSTTSYRYTISGSYPNFSASRPDRLCNFLSVMDGMAYAAWAGLRPMTELEYEKACRGTRAAIAGEYAWGTNTIVPSGSLTISESEDGTETITTDVSAGACVYGNRTHSGGDGGLGPLRAGIFATSTANRKSSGATFYGAMEMSGSLWERPVTLGNITGRNFLGAHGNGSLSATGFATISDWPGYSSGVNSGATGSGFRCGYWIYDAANGRVSHRFSAAYTYTARTYHYGFRAGRTQ
jgi:formylglycine-generating enzyme required for sulfatase activity